MSYPDKEVCAECAGVGVIESASTAEVCSFCGGQGWIDKEMLAPPSPPALHTITVIREDSSQTYRNVVSFEPRERSYLFIDSRGTRGVIPYTGDIYSIKVVPNE